MSGPETVEFGCLRLWGQIVGSSGVRSRVEAVEFGLDGFDPPFDAMFGFGHAACEFFEFLGRALPIRRRTAPPDMGVESAV
ncbi:hypothetical protein BV210_19250 (plasmid) [Halorientalis sp. IM1011]|nr:hypothetical protein BV210_19250 [Halorientalis sp. IM1011]